MNRRPFWLSASLIVITISAGLAIRFAHLGMPAWLVKYGGSALWAIAVYWLVSSVLSAWSAGRAAMIAVVIATLVEFLKLVHTSPLEEFRHTLAGVLLLGRIFSFKDIAVYWLAIAVAATFDWQLRRFLQ